MAPTMKKCEKDLKATVEGLRDDVLRVAILERDVGEVKDGLSAVREDIAEIKGAITHIRGSIVGIHEKMGLLDLIAQKLLVEDADKQVEDVKKLEEPSLMDLCRCWIVGTKEDKVKKQPEEEILASEDSNQIVSNIGGSLRKFDQIVDQIQLSYEEKKTEEDEIGIVSDVRGLLEKDDQVLKQEELISAPETTRAAEEEQTDELNRNTKKKKRKRWKKRFLTVQKCLAENQSSGKDVTSRGSGKDWFGVFSTGRKDTLQHKGGKLREAKRGSYAHQMLDKMHLRRELVMKKKKRKKMKVTKPKRSKYTLEKGKNKTEMRCAGKGFKHDKEVYQRTYGKLSWKYRLDKKQLVKGKGFKFKLKHDMPEENITQRLSGNHIACIWNSELELELELFWKIFSHWSKKKHGCGRTYVWCDKLLQLSGPVLRNGELSICINASKRVTSKYKGRDYRKFISLVTMNWTKLMIRPKKQMANYKCRNKTECVLRIGDVLFKRSKREICKNDTKRVVISIFSLMKMRFWPEGAKTSKIFKDLGSVLMHIAENQIRGLSAQLNDVKHSVFEEVQGEGIHKRVELTLQTYKGVTDGLPLEMDCSYVLLRLQGTEILKNLEVKLEETEDGKKKKEELKVKFEGMGKVVNAVLEDKVVVAIMSGRVVHSPCCLVTGDYSCTADMERNVKAQAMGKISLSGYKLNKKTVDINPEILILGEQRKRADADKYNKSVEDIALLLFETALLTSKFILNKPNTFGSRIHMMIEPSLRSHDEQVQMTCTEVEMDQGQGVIIVLRNGGHSNALKTQEGVEKLLYWEEMVIAGLQQLLPNPTDVEDNVLMGSTESWSSVEGYIAIMVRFFGMTLGTRSILKGGVLIREAITG